MDRELRGGKILDAARRRSGLEVLLQALPGLRLGPGQESPHVRPLPGEVRQRPVLPDLELLEGDPGVQLVVAVPRAEVDPQLLLAPLKVFFARRRSMHLELPRP